MEMARLLYTKASDLAPRPVKVARSSRRIFSGSPFSGQRLIITLQGYDHITVLLYNAGNAG